MFTYKTNFSILLAFLFSVNSFGIDCNYKENEGKEINLRAKGGPLDKFETYDQGNIGSCPSNAVGTVLTALTGGRVQPSANHLHAATYSISDEKRKKDQILDGAYPCEVFNSAKKLDRICATQTVYLDELTRNGIDIGMKALGDLYSSTRGEHSALKDESRPMELDSAARATITELSLFLKNNQKKYGEACRKEQKIRFDEFFFQQNSKQGLQGGFGDLFTNAFKDIDSFIQGDLDLEGLGSNFGERGNEVVRKQLIDQMEHVCNTTDCKNINESPHDIYPSSETKDLYCAEVEKLPRCQSFNTDIKDTIFEIYEDLRFNKISGRVAMDRINNSESFKKAPLFKKIIINKLFKTPAGSLKSNERLRNLFMDDVNRGKIYGAVMNHHKCREAYNKIFKEFYDLYIRPNKEQVSSGAGECDPQYEVTQSVLKTIGNIPITYNNYRYYEYIKNMLDQISQPKSFHKTFERLFVDKESCSKYGRNITPSKQLGGYNCTARWLISTPANVGEKFEGESDEAYAERNRDKKIKNNQAFVSAVTTNQLKRGAPVIFSICTGFFYDPNYSIDFNPENCDTQKAHGFHSISVTGVRCKEGKLQYLLQNSWGNNACNDYINKKTGKPNEALECYKKKDPVTGEEKDTGSFWVSEDVLVPNIYRTNVIRKDGS